MARLNFISKNVHLITCSTTDLSYRLTGLGMTRFTIFMDSLLAAIKDEQKRIFISNRHNYFALPDSFSSLCPISLLTLAAMSSNLKSSNCTGIIFAFLESKDRVFS